MSSYSETLQALRAAGNFRSIPQHAPHNDAMVDLSTNDYLGLSLHPELQTEFFSDEANRAIAFSSSAARFLASNQQEHQLLEEFLSALYDGRPTLLFNSGYHANTGLVSALASESGTLIVADKLVHASIIDGITLSHAPFKRFLHNDFNRLERILAQEHNNYARILVVVESIYSMDGDSTNLDALVALKRRYANVILYVDEAHALGVLGRQGLGMCHDHPAFSEIDVVMGTFGKAVASSGAFCVTTDTLRDYAVNRARSFIFSTAIPPINSAWTRFIFDKITRMDARRERLATIAQTLQSALDDMQLSTDSTPSHIRPVIAGSSDRAIAMSRQLLERGFKVLPIRTPTVPPGTERLRISLNADITDTQLSDFVQALRAIV